MTVTLVNKSYNGTLGSSEAMKQVIYRKMVEIMSGVLNVFKVKDRKYLLKLKNRTLLLPSEVRKVMYLYETVICPMAEE